MEYFRISPGAWVAVLPVRLAVSEVRRRAQFRELTGVADGEREPTVLLRWEHLGIKDEHHRTFRHLPVLGVRLAEEERRHRRAL